MSNFALYTKTCNYKMEPTTCWATDLDHSRDRKVTGRYQDQSVIEHHSDIIMRTQNHEAFNP